MPKGVYVRTLSQHEDQIGLRYSRLITVRVFDRQNGHVRWVCRCDCGKQHVAKLIHLRNGLIQSCGCYNREKTIRLNTTHGQALSVDAGGCTPEYTAWRGMKERCHNQNNSHYHNYGGRGISVCAEWRDNFEAFFAHLGPRPSPNYSVDRIDNNRNYEPGNIRWATVRQQALNKQASGRLLDINDQPVSFASVAEYLGLTRSAFMWSMQQSGIRIGADQRARTRR